MRIISAPLSALAGLFLLSLAIAGGGPAEIPPELKASPVTVREKLTVGDVLGLLKKQTGNALLDGRTKPVDEPLPWDLDRVTFWQAADALAKKANARVSLFHTPGAVALVDGPWKDIPVGYDGLFRVSLQRIALVRDVEEGNHLCQLSLLAAWEPRFRPYYMEMGKTEATYTGKNGKDQTFDAPGQGKQEVSGAGATTLPLRFPAPTDRALNKMGTLKGSFSVVGPTRLLSFRFDKLAPIGKKGPARNLKQEGVLVALPEIATHPDRWSFTVQIENPPGVPEFESYQSWLGNNHISLQKEDGKMVWEPLPEEAQGEVFSESAHKALIRYHFTESKFLSTTKLDDWTLVYTTPHRIVRVPVRFELKNLELP